MPNIRIKDIPATASATVNGDFFAVDSNASTRKLNAFSPTFGGNATVGGTLTVSGATMSVGGGSGSIVSALDGTAGNYKLHLFRSGGVDRWYCGLQAATETGSNAGAPFGITALSDAGAQIDVPLQITRAAGGAVTIVRPTAITNTTASTTTSSGALVVGNGTSGGLGVGGSANIGGQLKVTNATIPDLWLQNTSGANSAYRNVLFRQNSNGTFKLLTTSDAGVLTLDNILVGDNATGTLLFGTATNSNNGRLQLAAHTANTGGIGFGTGTSLYNDGISGVLRVEKIGGGGFGALHLYSSTQLRASLSYNGTTGYLDAPVGSLTFRTNGTVDALTLDGSQNATFAKDILLGTNGPSVPSTLSGRAPRQGLVFDGTTNATMTLGSAIGTGDFTAVVWVNPNSTSGVQLLIGDSSGNGSMSLNGASLRWFDLTGGSKTFTSTVTAGKMSMVTIVRSGTTLTSYANAIAGDTHTSAHNLSGTSWVIGGYGGGDRTTGIVGGPTIYNRALTQDELRKLYENGAPAAADLGIAGSVPPSNTALSGETFTNFQYDTFTGASTTGFTATETGGQGCQGTTGRVSSGTFLGLAPAGTRYLVTFTATLTSGVPPVVAIGKVNVGTISASSIVTNGANTHILTTTAALTAEFGPNSGNVFFASVGNTSYSISGFSVTRLGTVLAPDATQTGGGLTWYDTSGNGANITLPASGVSWNVPFSGNITGGSTLVLRTNNTTALSLDSNQNANLAGSYLFLGGAGSNFYIRSTGSNNGLIRGNVLSADFASAFVLRNDTGTAEYLRIENPSGNVLIGGANNTNNYKVKVYGSNTSVVEGLAIYNSTPYASGSSAESRVALGRLEGSTLQNMGAIGARSTVDTSSVNGSLLFYTRASDTLTQVGLWNYTGSLILGPSGTADSSNGRLQLATHTASSGGIGFGADVTLYRSAADTLRTDDTFQAAGGIASGSYLGAPDCYLNNAAGTTRAIYWQTAGVSRWALYTNSSTESGSNAGSNLTLSRYSDAGAYINDPLTINRATGNVTINGNFAINGTVIDPVITGTILEDIFTITDAAAFEVDPGNGSIQLITLGASRTPKATNFAAGESVTMMIDDGTAFTLTWTDATWGTGGVKWVGGSAPTLATTGYTVIQLWKVGTQVYGARVGDVV